MKRNHVLLLMSVVFFLLMSLKSHANDSMFERSTPERQGFDSAIFVEMLEDIRRENIDVRSVIVMRKDKIVLEFYRYPYTRETLQHTMSVGKSVVSTVAGMLLDSEPSLALDHPIANAADISPASNSDVRNITLRDALTMTTGLSATDDNTAALNEITKNSHWVRNLLALPMSAPPGKEFGYASFVSHWVARYLEKESHHNLIEFTKSRLFKPLDINDAQFQLAPDGSWMGGGGIWMTARDMLAFGKLYAQKGKWNGEKIVSKSWVKAATRNQIGNLTAKIGEHRYDKYGYFWWVYDGAYAAQGVGGQLVFVIPGLDIVTVVTAADESFPIVDDYVLRALTSIFFANKANPDMNARLSSLVSEFASPDSSGELLKWLFRSAIDEQWYDLASSSNQEQQDFCAFKFERKGDALSGLVLKRCDGPSLFLNLGGMGNPGITSSTQVQLPSGENQFICEAQWLSTGELLVRFHELGYPVVQNWTFSDHGGRFTVSRRYTGADSGLHSYTSKPMSKKSNAKDT